MGAVTTTFDLFLRETVDARARARILAFARSEAGHLEVPGNVYGADLYREDQVAVVWDDLDPTREERVPWDEFMQRVLELPDP